MRHYESTSTAKQLVWKQTGKKWWNAKPTSVLVPAGTFQIWLDSPREILELHDTPAVQQQAREERLEDVAGFTSKPDGPAWNFGTDATPHITSEAGLRHLLLDGWPEGTKEARALAAQIESALPDPKAFRRLFRWDEFEGEEASFERAQVGLAPWRATYRNWKVGCGIVEIVTSWGDTCDVSYDLIKWSGAALLAFADILDRADLRAEIVLLNVAHAVRSISDLLIIRLQLKEAHESLSAETIAAVVSHPGIWRTYGLAGYELAPWYMGPARSHNHERMSSRFSFGDTSTIDRVASQGLYGNPRALTVHLDQAASASQAKRVVEDALANLTAQLTSKGEL